STATTEENVPSGNGNVAASPRTTVTFELRCRSASLLTYVGSYSRLVTRPARRSNSSVVAPGPAPTSRTWSPNSYPDRIHGSSRRSVTKRHREEPQNQFSNLFMAGPVWRGSFHFRPVRPGKES